MFIAIFPKNFALIRYYNSNIRTPREFLPFRRIFYNFVTFSCGFFYIFLLQYERTDG